jgi:hypothetical protein
MDSETAASDLVDRLVRHGLGQGEARCYVAMLAPHAFKVSEVAGAAGLPRSRAYELIRSLVRAGLCTEVGGGVARFRAVPPNEAIGRLEAFLAEQSRRRTAALSGILQALGGLGGLRPGSDQDPVDMLRRRDQVYSAYERAIAGARDEVCSVAPLAWEPIDPDAMRARLAAGVRFRTIHETATLDSDLHRPYLGYHAGLGFESRFLDSVDILFSLIDRGTVFLSLRLPGVNRPTVQLESLQIRHAGLGQVLHEAFERLWERAVPFADAVQAAGYAAPAGGWPDPRGQDTSPVLDDGRSAGPG